jgi:hypothetical protein
MIKFKKFFLYINILMINNQTILYGITKKTKNLAAYLIPTLLTVYSAKKAGKKTSALAGLAGLSGYIIYNAFTKTKLNKKIQKKNIPLKKQHDQNIITREQQVEQNINYWNLLTPEEKKYFIENKLTEESYNNFFIYFKHHNNHSSNNRIKEIIIAQIVKQKYFDLNEKSLLERSKILSLNKEIIESLNAYLDGKYNDQLRYPQERQSKQKQTQPRQQEPEKKQNIQISNNDIINELKKQYQHYLSDYSQNQTNQHIEMIRQRIKNNKETLNVAVKSLSLGFNKNNLHQLDYNKQKQQQDLNTLRTQEYNKLFEDFEKTKGQQTQERLELLNRYMTHINTYNDYYKQLSNYQEYLNFYIFIADEKKYIEQYLQFEDESFQQNQYLQTKNPFVDQVNAALYAYNNDDANKITVATKKYNLETEKIPVYLEQNGLYEIIVPIAKETLLNKDYLLKLKASIQSIKGYDHLLKQKKFLLDQDCFVSPLATTIDFLNNLSITLYNKQYNFDPVKIMFNILKKQFLVFDNTPDTQKVIDQVQLDLPIINIKGELEYKNATNFAEIFMKQYGIISNDKNHQELLLNAIKKEVNEPVILLVSDPNDKNNFYNELIEQKTIFKKTLLSDKGFTIDDGYGGGHYYLLINGKWIGKNDEPYAFSLNTKNLDEKALEKELLTKSYNEYSEKDPSEFLYGKFENWLYCMRYFNSFNETQTKVFTLFKMFNPFLLQALQDGGTKEKY